MISTWLVIEAKLMIHNYGRDRASRLDEPRASLTELRGAFTDISSHISCDLSRAQRISDCSDRSLCCIKSTVYNYNYVELNRRFSNGLICFTSYTMNVAAW